MREDPPRIAALLCTFASSVLSGQQRRAERVCFGVSGGAVPECAVGITVAATTPRCEYRYSCRRAAVD